MVENNSIEFILKNERRKSLEKKFFKENENKISSHSLKISYRRTRYLGNY